MMKIILNFFLVSFNWKNPLQLKPLFKDEKKMIQDQVSSYCQNSLMPRILKANREAKFDKEIMKEMGSMGMLGSTLKGYGLSGVSSVAYGLMAREVER